MRCFLAFGAILFMLIIVWTVGWYKVDVHVRHLGVPFKQNKEQETTATIAPNEITD